MFIPDKYNTKILGSDTYKCKIQKQLSEYIALLGGICQISNFIII
jgi:hypothetical protein